MHPVEMRMMIWMCGHTKSNKIRNEDIRMKMRVRCGGQVEGSETDEEEMHRCTSWRCER